MITLKSTRKPSKTKKMRLFSIKTEMLEVAVGKKPIALAFPLEK
jgi:hypothetical protein